jgi:hypothetical protein
VKLRYAVELGWWIIVGGVVGFVAAAIVDAFVSPWQGVWTGLFMGAGALLLPAVAITVARRLRLSAEDAQTVRVFLRLVGSGLVWVATLSVPYVAMWMAGPQLSPETAFSMAAVGVLVWPGLAALVRLMIGWPPVRPLVWTAIWLFGGVVLSGTVLGIRAGSVPNWRGGLVLGWLVLLPFAGYAVWRARRPRVRPGSAGLEP